MRRLRGDDRAFVAVVAAAAVASLLATSPLVGADNSGWARYIVAGTPQQIWASSHFGQVADYAVLRALTLRDPDATAIAAMRVMSYALGLVYIGALAILATTVPKRARIPMFLIGAISPLTVFLHGEEEIPYYPFPLLVLAIALWRRAGSPRPAVTALGGLAAALHGVGLFFLPGIVALGWRAAGSGLSARDRIVAVFEQLLVFFGPSGVLFVLYIVAFPSVSIIPGDAGGGGQRTLWIPLFGSIAAFNEFRAYSFFSLTHLRDVALVLAMGAPALIVLAGWALVARDSAAAQLRATAPLAVLAGCGIVFVAFFYAGVSVLVTQSILVPALSLAQVVAAVIVLSGDAQPWRRSFPLLLIATIAATAFDWTHAGTSATPF